MKTSIDYEIEQGYRDALENILTAPGTDNDEVFRAYLRYAGHNCNAVPVERVILRPNGRLATLHRTQGSLGMCITTRRKGRCYICSCGRVIWDER